MKWLQNSILYTELNDLILDNELRATDKSFTGSQVCKKIIENFMLYYISEGIQESLSVYY